MGRGKDMYQRVKGGLSEGDLIVLEAISTIKSPFATVRTISIAAKMERRNVCNKLRKLVEMGEVKHLERGIYAPLSRRSKNGK